jgi:spermidine/putrescine transport system permease protein
MRPRASRLALLITAVAFVAVYAPVVAMIIRSFWDANAGEAGGWTLDGYRLGLADADIQDALLRSLLIGFSSAAAATLLGTLAALALERGHRRFPGRRAFETALYFPLLSPDILFGLSLLLWFVLLGIPLGVPSIIMAHATFGLPYVILTVRARLAGMDVSLEDAARDLGASPRQAFFKVTLPLILPGILGGALIAFTLSFDDFMIAFFTGGAGNDTLPVKLYGLVRFGIMTQVSAISSVVFLATAGIAGVLTLSRLVRRG